MTPQQRHIDAANRILTRMIPFSEWSPAWQAAVNELAQALAEAENRAAWDVVKMAHATGAIPLDLIDSVAREVTPRYGHRPTTENQP